MLDQESNTIEIMKKPNVFVIDNVCPKAAGNENMPSHLGSKFMCKISNILYTIATPFLRMHNLTPAHPRKWLPLLVTIP
jgi:hypothetical protein